MIRFFCRGTRRARIAALKKYIRSCSNILPLAWLQLIQQKGRLAVAIAGIAFADMLIFIQLGFQDALYDSAVEPHRNLQADLVINQSTITNPIFRQIFSTRSTVSNIRL